MLTKEQILTADDLKTEEVDVSEWWGDTVLIKLMDGTAKDEFEQLLSDEGRKVNVRAKLCALTICDLNGNLLFSDKDIAALGKKSSEPLDKIAMAALKLNGMSPEAIEELEKNSQSARSESSISD